MLRRLRYLYHRRQCALALREAAQWWFYFSPDYWRFHYAIAMRHARKMWALR